jgi:thiamine transport system substrate-binding protein
MTLKHWAAAAAVLPLAALAGCGSTGGTGSTSSTTSSGASRNVVLVTHESFAVSDSVLAGFRKQTGISVKVLRSGDAGAAVNQAILTKGKPQGDVFFGVDNTFLSRALKENLFTTYDAKGASTIPAQFVLDPQHRVTPIDYGDVCVNYDKKYFAEKKLDPPQTFADLAKPAYKNLLVTENAATSSPGLAFLLGSVANLGKDAAPAYWKQLQANGAEVVDGWEEAYNSRFSGASSGKGDKPLVVSYATSPVAEVAFSKKKLTEAPTGVAAGTCFRQVEFAGLLSGARNSENGRKLIDFLISPPFQQDMPMQMFVSPVQPGTKVPEVFSTFAVKVDEPKTVSADDIAANREQWIKAWTQAMVR